jgi:hypothetical protein
MPKYHWRLLSIILLFHILPAGTSATDGKPELLATDSRNRGVPPLAQIVNALRSAAGADSEVQPGRCLPSCLEPSRAYNQSRGRK